MTILQRLERFNQRALRASFRKIGIRRETPALELGQFSRILLVRTDKIGDAVFSTPLFNLLRAALPDASIDLVLGRRNRAVAPLLPAMFRQIFCAPHSIGEAWRLAFDLRRNHYDVAINLLGNDSNTAALITILSGARLKLGFANAASGFYHRVVPLHDEPVPFARQVLSLATGLGLPVPEEAQAPLALVVPPTANAAVSDIAADLKAASRPIAMINISCTMPERFWGAVYSIRLAKDLRQAGLEPVIVAAPVDAAAQRQIAQASGARAIPPRQSLAEFAAILSCADLVITPDTSVTHIAAALGKPTVMLAESAFKAAEGLPWGVPNRILAGSGQTVRTIPYEAIVEAVMSLARQTVLQPDRA